LGRGKPARDFIAEAAVHEGHVDRLTTDQYEVLDMVERNPHIEIVGGAGSGKTWPTFHDDHQRVFGRRGRPAVDFTQVGLHENLRNTRQIATAFSELVTDQLTPRGGAGAPVRYIECAADAVLDAACDEAVNLLENGWEPLHVALLTTCHRHPVQVEQQRGGQDSYWSNFWTGHDMFYGTVMGFKGLERPAVVLAIDGFHDGIDPDEVLYCGMSRARDLLIVASPPVASPPPTGAHACGQPMTGTAPGRTSPRPTRVSQECQAECSPPSSTRPEARTPCQTHAAGQHRSLHSRKAVPRRAAGVV
jgi:hypothetical protein